MLSTNQWQVINSLVKDMSTAQRAWLSGYLAGINNEPPALPADTAAAAVLSPAAAPAPATAAAPITIVYGSQGGNGKTIAAALAETLQATATECRLLSLAQYKTAWLKKERVLLIVISTHGEGEPPDDAKAFYDFLFSSRAPQLPALKFATLALGDSSYDHFCKTGKDIHTRLHELGGSELAPLVEADSDYETPAAQWQQTINDILPQKNSNGNGALLPAASSGAITLPGTANTAAITAAAAKEAPIRITRANPYAAPIIDNILLTKPPRRTMHLELALADSNIDYQPGDAIGIYPQNPPAVADKIMATLRLSENDNITIDADTDTADNWLRKQLDICRPTAVVLRRYQALSGSDALAQLLNDSDKFRRYLSGRDYGDVLADFPPPEGKHSESLACLRRLTPRLYSLSSSQQLREDEVHLLIALTEYEGYDQTARTGVCSHYLSTLQTDDTVNLYVQRNDNFRLPADDSAPVIMIGPGTGVAPFRAFMEQRETGGASGDNWLFFGSRNRRDEFYYQTEWQEYRKSGLLTRLDVAFSRSGKKKMYVQDKLRQHSAALWQWLQNDAYIYVCGDSKMAAGVHDQLAALIADHGGEDGTHYLQQLQSDGRYQRDVY